MKRIFLFFFLYLSISCGILLAANTDDIHVTAEVDKAFLTVGDLLTYTVTIEHAPDIQILSSIPSPATDIVEVKKVEDINKRDKKRIITGKKFTLTTFRLGEFILDPGTIEYRVEKQPLRRLQTNKLYLTVKSIAGGEKQEDIRDVKSVVPLQLRIKKIAVILLLLLLIPFGYWIYRILRKKKNEILTTISPLTPEEEALQRLHELFESDILKRGFIKMHYLRLSEILRFYFEKRYNILAVELTTTEILRDLHPQNLETSLFKKIRYVLEAADLAKFAKWVPTTSETLQIDTQAEEIIRESAPAPAIEPVATEGSHGV